MVSMAPELVIEYLSNFIKYQGSFHLSILPSSLIDFVLRTLNGHFKWIKN